ncbi:uncharacterized protein LOC113127392 isoform X2 [Mastacembelus armatus]|nr:uncharacterized protein LOC113127392 isoform X2 [Mastacembelus armatus]
MRVCWMFMILLGCRLSHATESQNTCPCNVELKTVCIPGSESVHVPCPNVTAGEVRFELFKDDNETSHFVCNFQNNTWNCSGKPNQQGMKLQKNSEHKSFSFILDGLTDSSQGVYTCQGTVTYPPPLKTVPSTLRVRVLKEGNQCKCNNAINKPDDNIKHEFHWAWILVVVLLIVYSLTVTIIAFVTWVKLQRVDSHSDYMNTKPRASRDRRKKKGVQNPIPRHF